jgi:hypothetical protein
MSGSATPREAGQAMVEFTLGALALFTIIIALMVFGYTFGKILDLRSATSDAARRVAIEAENPNAESIARQKLYDQVALTDDSDLSMSITPGPPWNHGDEIVVRTSAPHEMDIIGLTVWSGTIRAERRIRVE